MRFRWFPILPPRSITDEAVSGDDVETILQAGINAPSAMNGQPWHFSVITDAAVLEQISGDMSMGRGMPPAGELPEDLAMPDMGQPEDFPEDAGQMPPEDMELPEGFTPPGKDGEMQPPANMPGMGTPGGMAKAGLTDAPLAIVISCAEGSALDAGLACQNMSVTAQLLGYGTKIISSPTMALNGEKQEDYRQLLGIPEDQAAAAILLIGREDTTVDETADGYTGATARNPMDEVVTFVSGS